MAAYDRAIEPDQVIAATGELLRGVGSVESNRFSRARAVHPTAGTWSGVYRSTEPFQFRGRRGGKTREQEDAVLAYVFDEPVPTEDSVREDLMRRIREMEDFVFMAPNPGRRRPRRF